jgi:arylsulfatase A-like enzyme
MKNTLFASFLVLFSIASFGQSKPNVIVILADDMGYGDIQAINPNSKILTPNLDKLTRSGMYFTEAHSGSAVCTPTRYGLLTGRYAFRSSMKTGVLTGYDPPLIESDRTTIADLFKQRNYATACIGKWHLGLGWQAQNNWEPIIKGDPWSEMNTGNVDYKAGLTESPNELGFDYSFIIPSSLDIAPYFYIKNKKFTSTNYQRKPAWKDDRSKGAWYRLGDTADDFVHEEVLGRFADESLAFIDQNSENPFFMYVPFSAPHSPWLPTKEFQGKSEAGVYGDFMMMVDAQVGKILNKLEEKGIRENTLVIFTSDNGANWEDWEKEEFKHEANFTRSGRKSDAWDGGHHVPFVASWPTKIQAGTKNDGLVCLTDLMATMSDVLQIELKANEGEDSKSILPILMGKETKGRDFAIHHSVDGHFAIRKGDWKYVEAFGSGGWSLAENKAKEAGLNFGQLYNMKNDPFEKSNLIESHRKEANELMHLLQRVKFAPEKAIN